MSKIYRSEALAAVHETMEALHKVGAIGKRPMGGVDCAVGIALCCPAAFGQVSHTIASPTAPIPSPASLSAQPSTNPAAITLPLEVIGPDGTTVSASFVTPAEANLSGPLRLSMTIHGLRFD